MKFEVLPVFKNDDGSYKYADSNNGGCWRTTNPVPEIDIISTGETLTNNNLRHLCRMTRAWKYYCNVPMNGLLIDSLAYRFLTNWAERDKSFLYYDWMTRDFFQYLKNQTKGQTTWFAIGSRQAISNPADFRYKATIAYNRSVDAIQLLSDGKEWSAKQNGEKYMAPDSQVKIIESQIRELYGRVVWSHKTQEKCADIILRRHTNLKIIQIALSALTTTGILVSVFGDNSTIGIIAAVLSALLFGLNSYTKDYDLGEIAQKHSTSASELWNIRESYLSLLTDLRTEELDLEIVLKKRIELQENLYNVYKGAPRTISAAYKEATKGLKSNEELTFSDEEIDNLLPKSLRIGL